MSWWQSVISKYLKPGTADLHRQIEAAFEARQEILRGLSRDGWKLYLYEPPPLSEVVMFTRDGITTSIAAPDTLHPESNVAGLWWRPIRETVDVTPNCKPDSP